LYSPSTVNNAYWQVKKTHLLNLYLIKIVFFFFFYENIECLPLPLLKTDSKFIIYMLQSKENWLDFSRLNGSILVKPVESWDSKQLKTEIKYSLIKKTKREAKNKFEVKQKATHSINKNLRVKINLEVLKWFLIFFYVN
jgi:hypothetical protein